MNIFQKLTNFGRSKSKNLFFKRKKRIWLIFCAFFIISVIGLFIYAEIKLSKLVLGGLGESFSTNVYSRSLNLKTGLSPFYLPPQPPHVLETLRFLEYKSVVNIPKNPGEYQWSTNSLQIYLRDFSTPINSQISALVQANWDNDNGWTLFLPSGEPVNEVYLEPVLVTEISGDKKIRRDPTNWDEIPDDLKNAVISVEDHRFYSHFGIHPSAILRAAWHNITKKGSLHGGSTITQQLAKNLFLTPKRTFRRKFLEAFLAIYLELRYSKEHILTLYLNHIYMGQDGFVSIGGVKSASEYYFSKPLNELSLEECALLAGLIRSPYRYNPFRDPNQAISRRRIVLRRMRALEFISEEQYETAVAAPLTLASQLQSGSDAFSSEYFVAEVVRQLTPSYGEDALSRYGLHIHTTMDPVMQMKAQNHLKKVRYQAALISLDPHNGHVLAMVGGKNFSKSQFNRATQAHRQPGSSFKPFVYGAAIENGWSPASILQDVKKEFPREDKSLWKPRNYDGIYHGSVTIRMALAKSLNAATVDLTEKIGSRTIVEFAHRLGIKNEIESSLAVGLGVSEVTLYQLTAAYAPFANGGDYITPTVVTAVSDSENKLLERHISDRHEVIDPTIAYMMTSLLESVISTGTAKSLSTWGWKRSSAGKTGTTNDGKDAWFIGYTPQLLTGIWYGDDEAKSIKASGPGSALPLWYKFMNDFHKNLKSVSFPQPEGLVMVTIDPVSGGLALSGCPTKREEIFLPGTEPTEKCSLHPGGIKGWFYRLFKKK